MQQLEQHVFVLLAFLPRFEETGLVIA